MATATRRSQSTTVPSRRVDWTGRSLALEIAPSSRLHDQERRAVELRRDVGVDHPDHVIALDAGRGARLALETVQRLGGRADAGEQHLERQMLAGARVLDLVDRAHSPLRDETHRHVPGGDDGGKARRGYHSDNRPQTSTVTFRRAPGMLGASARRPHEHCRGRVNSEAKTLARGARMPGDLLMHDEVSEKIGALSVDARWVADKLSEFGFTMDQLEALYPEAERVALGWAARGDTRIGIDLVTGEIKRRTKLRFSNTVRPFLARMLRDRRPELRDLIKVSTTSRGRNKELKVALDYLNVVAVVHQPADPSAPPVTILLAEVPAFVERLRPVRRGRR